MEKIQLNATTRTLDMSVKTLRKEGFVPAVLYGNGIKNLNLSVKSAEFEKVFRKAGESTLVELKTDDGKTHPVLVQDVQYHNLAHTPIHIDFYQVNMSDKLKANVAIEFTGEAPAVKTLGGVLVKNISEVQVECLPADLPHNFSVDISALKTFEDSILVKDIKAGDKVKILSAPEEVLAKVQPPRDVEKELSTEAKEDVAAVLAATEADKAKPEAEEPAEEKK